MMNEAIQKEDYETASKFRDLLKDKENKHFRPGKKRRKG